MHIEHPVTDYATWHAAFDRFAAARSQAGVRAYTIRRPVDDDRYVSLDLEFDDREAAARFLRFLEEKIWAIPSNSPGLAGSPVTRILVTC
ncbi:hypothetical protein Rai3103_07015 [Raineyella fluvialis]|uniref:ABM domain-containing protein n=1 Tax=Raineyella fluvialis TaxID=2662261 RepID=A0A5Q2FLA2_9ACTN|nr:hypothetical protein Rai3103_07015 [Raineyella fluvialis]